MNKLCKILTSLTLASTFVVSFVSCGNSNDLLDDDFDGLRNKIDPDPHNNKYELSIVKNENDEEETGKLTLTIDYRDFLKTDYQYNLGILGSFLINSFDKTKVVVHNNVYPKNSTPESEVSPLLAQIGAENIELLKISDNKYDVDPYDVVDVLMGHHSFTVSNKTYQIFFAVIIPYPTQKGWISNLDLGAADENDILTESYKQLEGANHEDWTNHLDHKGFSVSTTRVLGAIENYQQKYKNKNTSDAITFVTGHSRGGAVSNLIGKYFVDNNKRVCAYCFNPARTTLSDVTAAKKDSYNNSIFNIINNDDLVSRVPSFGFKLYGKDIKQDINKNRFFQFARKDYNGNSSETINKVEQTLNNLLTKDGVVSRNNFYEFRDEDDDYPEQWEGTMEEMTELLSELNNGIFMPNNSYSRKCFEYSEIKGDDPDCYIKFKTRPALIKGLFIDIIDKKDLSYLFSYLDLFDRLLADLLELYTLTDFTITGVIDGHLGPVTCVMAWQLGD